MSKLKANAKHLLLSAIVVGLLCAPLVSVALAEDNGRVPAADSAPAAENGQPLIAPAPQDSSSTSEDTPLLIEPRDANATDASTTDAPAEEGSLIATNTTDNSSYFVVGAAVVAIAVAVGASIAVFRSRRK